MGGIKHHLQQFGMKMDKDLSEIKDPLERDFAFKTTMMTPYCKHCGKQILMPSGENDPDRRTMDGYQIEVRMQAHQGCQSDYEQEQRAKQVKQDKEDWENMKAKYMKGRE